MRTSHLLQSDSPSDSIHQAAPHINSRGRCRRGGDLSKLDQPALQGSQDFIHCSWYDSERKQQVLEANKKLIVNEKDNN